MLCWAEEASANNNREFGNNNDGRKLGFFCFCFFLIHLFTSVTIFCTIIQPPCLMVLQWKQLWMTMQLYWRLQGANVANATALTAGGLLGNNDVRYNKGRCHRPCCQGQGGWTGSCDGWRGWTGTRWTGAITHAGGTQQVQITSPEENDMSYWLAFMRWRDNSDYEADHVFTVQQLTQRSSTNWDCTIP